MEFRDVIDGMKEQIFDSLPRQSDAWQNDVWEGIVRPRSAAGFKKELQRHLNGDLSSDAAIKAFDVVRADLFAMRARDAVDASLASFVPPLEESDPFDVIEVLELVRDHMGYKLSKWASLTQLEELVALCERVPQIHTSVYLPTVNSILAFMSYSAAVLECDVDTKPNFGSMPHRVKLYSALNRFGSRLLSAFNDNPSE